MYVLGKSAGTLLAGQNFLGGSLGHVRAPPAAVFDLYPRLTRKSGGIPPFDHCPQKKRRFYTSTSSYMSILGVVKTTGTTVNLPGNVYIVYPFEDRTYNMSVERIVPMAATGWR